MTTSSDQASDIAKLVERIKPILAGHPPEVQGGALADLLAIWLASHHIAGDSAATRGLRAEILAAHLVGVEMLVNANANILGTTR
jgi:hypothetical protein